MSSTRKNTNTRSNEFYQKHYHKILVALIGTFFLTLVFVCILLYQIQHRPRPLFNTVAPDGKILELTAHEEPNLLSSTLITWATKAAVAAYTFDYVQTDKEIEALVRPYFTNAGWFDYSDSIQGLLKTIRENKLIVNGVVSGTPVISNQGEMPGRGYVWRIQIPFVVTYQSAGPSQRKEYTVTLTIVRVPTTQNPTGIGIDQFVMR